eukprot:337333-Prorocentrum_minimum.AAC.1
MVSPCRGHRGAVSRSPLDEGGAGPAEEVDQVGGTVVVSRGQRRRRHAEASSCRKIDHQLYVTKKGEPTLSLSTFISMSQLEIRRPLLSTRGVPCRAGPAPILLLPHAYVARVVSLQTYFPLLSATDEPACATLCAARKSAHTIRRISYYYYYFQSSTRSPPVVPFGASGQNDSSETDQEPVGPRPVPCRVARLALRRTPPPPPRLLSHATFRIHTPVAFSRDLSYSHPGCFLM